jgi:hypothetical protein
MKNKIIEAIKKINPVAQISISGNDINSITWENGTPPIPKEQILAIIPQVELDIAMETLRAKRNKALADSDWTVLSDVPLNPAMRSAWMNYRTLLRNITDNLTTVEDVKAVTLPIPPK